METAHGSSSQVSSPSPTAHALRVAPGDGYLARRETALLFVPERTAPTDDGYVTSGVLLAAFMTAPTDSNAAEAVRAAALTTGASTCSFVIISWHADIDLVVSGNVTLATSEAAAPEISGQETSTLVEHTLQPTSELVRVARSAEDVDGLTDLHHGVVPASGFDLVLRVADPRATPPPASADETWPPNVLGLFDQDSRPPPAVQIGDEVLLVDQPYLVGRKPDPARAGFDPIATLTVADEKLSRNHLLITSDAGTVIVSDCGSLNGTVVVHHPAADPHRLVEGETIVLTSQARVYLGDQTLRLG